MPYTVRVAGLSEIKIDTGAASALEGLGYTRNGVEIRKESFQEEEKGDENGGDPGPAIEILDLGETAVVRLELNKVDYTVLAKVQRLKGGTAGQPAAAGSLIFSGSKFYRLVIANANDPWNWPCAVLAQEPQEIGPIGNKFRRTILTFRCYKHPTSGILHNTTTT